MSASHIGGITPCCEDNIGWWNTDGENEVFRGVCSFQGDLKGDFSFGNFFGGVFFLRLGVKLQPSCMIESLSRVKT